MGYFLAIFHSLKSSCNLHTLFVEDWKFELQIVIHKRFHSFCLNRDLFLVGLLKDSLKSSSVRHWKGIFIQFFAFIMYCAAEIKYFAPTLYLL